MTKYIIEAKEIHISVWECEAESKEHALKKFSEMDVDEIETEYSHIEGVISCIKKRN